MEYKFKYQFGSKKFKYHLITFRQIQITNYILTINKKFFTNSIHLKENYFDPVLNKKTMTNLFAIINFKTRFYIYIYIFISKYNPSNLLNRKIICTEAYESINFCML